MRRNNSPATASKRKARHPKLRTKNRSENHELPDIGLQNNQQSKTKIECQLLLGLRGVSTNLRSPPKAKPRPKRIAVWQTRSVCNEKPKTVIQRDAPLISSPQNSVKSKTARQTGVATIAARRIKSAEKNDRARMHTKANGISTNWRKARVKVGKPSRSATGGVAVKLVTAPQINKSNKTTSSGRVNRPPPPCQVAGVGAFDETLVHRAPTCFCSSALTRAENFSPRSLKLANWSNDAQAGEEKHDRLRTRFCIESAVRLLLPIEHRFF